MRLLRHHGIRSMGNGFGTAPGGTQQSDMPRCLGNTEGHAIAEFAVDRLGTYFLISQYSNGQSEPRFVLAIARLTSGHNHLHFGRLGRAGLSHLRCRVESGWPRVEQRGGGGNDTGALQHIRVAVSFPRAAAGGSGGRAEALRDGRP